VKRTEIAVILDCSGSMEMIREETIGSFNEQVQVIHDTTESEGAETCESCGHEDGMETKVTLVTFNTSVHDPKLWRETPSEIQELTPEDYQPRGATALRDAVGTTISELEKIPYAKDPDMSFLVIIISDGHENASTIWEQNKLARKIRALQKTKRWTFTYLGANQDLEQIQKEYAIPRGNIQAWDVSSTQMTNKGYYSNTAGTAKFLRAKIGGINCSTDFYGDNDSTATPMPSVHQTETTSEKNEECQKDETSG